MQRPFNVESPYRGRLADLVTKVVDVDVRIRGLEAERSGLLAEAYELAELEGTRLVLPEPGSLEAELSTVQARAVVFSAVVSEQELSQNLPQRQSSGAPRGSVAWRDRAHRVVRAELAASLHVSEWCISNDIAHAVDALERCPVLVAAQARGEVTEKHVRGVVEAGRIIGQRATEQVGTTLVDVDGVPLNDEAAELEIKRRYALLDQALLPHAQSLTPKLLAPVAKRIAEKLAGVSFDDRHRIAKRDRHIRLTELEDGMCHLSALLTSLEAHAIFDRLTQYGKRLQATDVSAAGRKASGAPSAAVPPFTQASDAPRTSGDSAQPRVPGPGDGTSALAAPGGSLLGAAAAAVLKRPLGEARADSLVSLLLEGEVKEQSEGPMKRRGPRVTARVQVLVPVSLTGRLDGATKPQAVAPQFGTGNTGGTDNAGGGDGTDNAGGAGIRDGWFQPELVGVGPIDTDTAALLSHDTPTWDMIVVDDGTRHSTCTCTCTHSGNQSSANRGSVSGVGSNLDTVGDILTVDGYRVPAHIRRYLAARDLRCRFPGCGLPVYRCDIDHTIAAEDGGPTSTENLGFACRGHHVLKHHGGCIPEQHGRGDFTWTMPSGRTYESRPPSKVAFSTAICSPDVQALIEQDRKRYPFGRGYADDDEATDARGPVDDRPQGSTRDSNHGDASNSGANNSGASNRGASNVGASNSGANNSGASNVGSQRSEGAKPNRGSTPGSGINSNADEQPF